FLGRGAGGFGEPPGIVRKSNLICRDVERREIQLYRQRGGFADRRLILGFNLSRYPRFLSNQLLFLSGGGFLLFFVLFGVWHWLVGCAAERSARAVEFCTSTRRVVQRHIHPIGFCGRRHAFTVLFQVVKLSVEVVE